MKFRIAILLGSFFLVMCSFDSTEKVDSYFKDDGDFYARSRIHILQKSNFKKPSESTASINLIENPSLDDLKIMEDYVKIYKNEGNVTAIRRLFLQAYKLASIPCRSSDLLSSYGDPIIDLRNLLGDEQFALCLEKMRPEVQSAVIYLLYYTYWPRFGTDKDFDEQRKSEEPYTFALSKKVARLKWPSDYE